MKYGFGSDYGIGQKYRPILVPVSVSDLVVSLVLFTQGKWITNLRSTKYVIWYSMNHKLLPNKVLYTQRWRSNPFYVRFFLVGYSHFLYRHQLRIILRILLFAKTVDSHSKAYLFKYSEISEHYSKTIFFKNFLTCNLWTIVSFRIGVPFDLARFYGRNSSNFCVDFLENIRHQKV